jgi:hypothetical protein
VPLFVLSPFLTFPDSLRHPCTTMPWTIWPALVVLWGVCWMFYGPIYCSWDWSQGRHDSEDLFNPIEGEEAIWPGNEMHSRFAGDFYELGSLSYNTLERNMPTLGDLDDENWPQEVLAETTEGLYPSTLGSSAPMSTVNGPRDKIRSQASATTLPNTDSAATNLTLARIETALLSSNDFSVASISGDGPSPHETSPTITKANHSDRASSSKHTQTEKHLCPYPDCTRCRQLFVVC